MKSHTHAEVVVGFVDTSFSVQEEMGEVEICVAILSPPMSPDSADISFEVLFDTVALPGEASGTTLTVGYGKSTIY